ncbi:unnamed protein product, partial [marine sediment metagenome]
VTSIHHSNPYYTHTMHSTDAYPNENWFMDCGITTNPILGE